MNLSHLDPKWSNQSFKKEIKTRKKTAANSLARGFLKLNLLIPLINF